MKDRIFKGNDRELNTKKIIKIIDTPQFDLKKILSIFQIPVTIYKVKLDNNKTPIDFTILFSNNLFETLMNFDNKSLKSPISLKKSSMHFNKEEIGIFLKSLTENNIILANSLFYEKGKNTVSLFILYNSNYFIEIKNARMLFDKSKDMGVFQNNENYHSICAKCKYVKNNDDIYIPIEDFLENNYKIKFTHGSCLKCKEEIFKEY